MKIDISHAAIAVTWGILYIRELPESPDGLATRTVGGLMEGGNTFYDLSMFNNSGVRWRLGCLLLCAAFGATATFACSESPA